MSYILDALKKSEAERLRRDAPGFADIPQQAAAARTPRWPWLVGGLLLVNAIVVSALLLRSPEAPTAGDSRPPAAVVVPAPVPVEAPPVAERAGAGIAPSGTAAAERRPATPAENTTVSPAVERPAAPATPAPPARSTRAPTLPPAPTAPPRTFMELRADGTLSLPDLHLDIHVYSSRPDERFVFVNMSKYREQDSLAEGPRVREINPEGVILEYRDQVFLLPRE